MATAEVGALRVTLGMDIAEFVDGSKKAIDITSGLVAKLGLIAGVAGAVGAAIGTKLSSAISKYVEDIKSAITQTDDIAEAADRFGLSISEVTAIVRDSKTPVDTLTKGLEALQQSIFDVASGDVESKAAQTFKAIGVSALDAAGKMRPVGDVIKEVADKFATYSDGLAKDTLATNLFKDAGKDLIDVLSKGSAGMREQADGGLTLGNVLADLYGIAEGKFKSAWDALSESFDNVLTAISTPGAKEFSATVRDWGNAALEALPSAKQIKDAFDSLFIAALNVEQRIERLGVNLAGFWRAAMALFNSDDVKTVNDQTMQALDQVDKRAAESLRNFQALAGGWKAVIEGPKEDKGEQKDPPIIQQAQKLTDAQRELNRQIQEGVNIARAARDPWQIYADQVAALAAAQAAGKITAEQYGVAQQKAVMIAVDAYAGFASDIGHSLMTVFNKSKGVAIAVGTIDAIGAGLKALSAYPPPFSYVAAAAALAAGMAQVARISSMSSSGGGGGGSAGGGAAAGTGGGEGAAPQLLTVRGINPNDMFSGTQMRELAAGLLSFQRDGGEVIIQ